MPEKKVEMYGSKQYVSDIFLAFSPCPWVYLIMRFYAPRQVEYLISGQVRAYLTK